MGCAHSVGSVPGSRTRSRGEGGREGRGLSNCNCRGCEELWLGARISIRSNRPDTGMVLVCRWSLSPDQFLLKNYSLLPPPLYLFKI